MKLFQYCFLSILIAYITNLSYATQKYVSKTGNNSNNGLTLATAWLTIGKAGASAVAGDTINIQAGTYNEYVPIYVTGNSTNGYITFRNYGDGEVIIDGTGLSGRALISIYNVSYIRVIGLTICNGIEKDAIGVLIEARSSYIEIRNNKIHDIHFSADSTAAVTSSTNSHPVLINGDDGGSIAATNIIIDNNEIYHCRTGYSEGLTVNGNVDGFQFTNNKIHDITNNGMDIAGNWGQCPTPALDQARNGIVKGNVVYNCTCKAAVSAGIYVDGAKNVIISNNIVHDCQRGNEVGCEVKGKQPTSGIIVRDNIYYHNSAAGLVIGGYSYPNNSGKVDSCSLLNNTLFSNDSLNTDGGELEISYTEYCKISNNIFYGKYKNLVATQDYQTGYPSIGLNINYNLWFCPDTSNMTFNWKSANYSSFQSYKIGTGNDINSILGDPLFISSSLLNPNFMIIKGSPVIDKGDPLFVQGTGETDFAGNNRVVNGRVDIGAYEFNNVLGINDRSNSINPNNYNLFQNYPNPFNPSTTINYEVPVTSKVMIKVFNILGDEVATLVNEQKEAGKYSVTFDASRYSSGVYFYRIQTSNFVQTKKMILRK